MKQVEDESVKVGLCMEVAFSLSKWIGGGIQITTLLRSIWPPSLFADTPGCITRISIFTVLGEG